MIRLRINELLGDRSHCWLAKAIQVEYSVIRSLASQRSQRIDYSTLEKLCGALECKAGDCSSHVQE
jgi:DNA-binding Xre family transcriptional regulator